MRTMMPNKLNTVDDNFNKADALVFMPANGSVTTLYKKNHTSITVLE